MTEPRSQRIEEAFLAQYADMDDETLRQIAEGQVPWVADGVYLYPARRAARELLKRRGVTPLPSVPAWDPEADSAPLGVRWSAWGAALFLVAGAAAALWWVRRPDVATDEAACAEARTAFLQSDFQTRHRGELLDCRRDGDVVTLEACIELTADALKGLAASRNPVQLAEIRRFANAPVPGRHCAVVDYARVQVDGHRPWRLVVRHPLEAP
ncbi:MAG: hypothetical protein IV100_31100 [Myxococcales bacterium]|nr:hypothetical protein [Myxococcales bacterium]